MTKLDSTKLLGFRIAHSKSVIGAKNGGTKPTVTSAKMGAKNGIKKAA